jgi:hypothetical protein
MSKFNELLENSPVFYSNDVEHIGWQLLVSRAEEAFRENNVPRMMEAAARGGDNIMKTADTLASTLKDGLLNSNMLPNIKQLSLKDIGRKAAQYFAKNLVGVKDTAIITNRALNLVLKQYGDKLGNMEELLKKQQKPGATQYADINVCEVFGEGPLCNLWRIGDCLMGYPEEAFEDGIDWLQCLFICE